ncbi:MAG: hypothetical protein HY819_13335 [Acidobacteria bacterium]|nr:hypothetical protein [Acidobacteriota bacterium]
MIECSNKNIHLFFKYVKSELTRKEEYSIDRHLQSCEDCLFNFAYVEEIYTKEHLLSSDEKTLFIKYLSDPIWKNELEKIKKEIKQEIIETIYKNNITKSDTVLTSIKLQSIDSNKVTLKKPKNIYNTYSNFPSNNKYLAVAFILIFTSLSTSIYLVINKDSNQSNQLSIVAPYSISSNNNTSNSIGNIYKEIANNNSVSNNLYQELDLAIDEYLEYRDISSIKKAREIATEIDKKHGDKYGMDLVKFYESVSPQLISKLSKSHQKIKSLMAEVNGDYYNNKINQAKELEQELLSMGAIIDAYKTKLFISKMQVKKLDFQSAKVIFQEGLSFSNKNNYLLLKAYFLMWQSKSESDLANFSQAQIGLEEVISTGTELGINELVVSSTISLAAIYHLTNEDKKALELSQSILAKPFSFTQEQTISLLQISGMSAFKLKFYTLADTYFYNSISLSKKINNDFFLALSYVFLATTLAERHYFTKADDYYTKAITLSETIKDKTSKMDLLSRIKGYQAKNKLLAGEFDQSANLYQETLRIMQALKLENNLELSQLNEGLAICLEKISDSSKAKEYFAKANYYKQIANDKNESVNCLLSFLPNNCSY